MNYFQKIRGEPRKPNQENLIPVCITFLKMHVKFVPLTISNDRSSYRDQMTAEQYYSSHRTGTVRVGNLFPENFKILLKNYYFNYLLKHNFLNCSPNQHQK